MVSMPHMAACSSSTLELTPVVDGYEEADALRLEMVDSLQSESVSFLDAVRQVRLDPSYPGSARPLRLSRRLILRPYRSPRRPR